MIILRWLAVTSHHSIMPVLAHDTQRSPQPEASPRVFLERQGPNGGTRANPWMHVENHISDWIDCIIPFSFTRCYANSNVFGWTSCPSGRQHDASLGCIQGRRRQTSKATSHKASEKGSDRMDWGPPPSPRQPKIQANFIPSNIIEGRSTALTDVPWFSQWKTIFRAFFWVGWCTAAAKFPQCMPIRPATQAGFISEEMHELPILNYCISILSWENWPGMFYLLTLIKHGHLIILPWI